MKKRLLGLLAIPLIVIGSLTYAEKNDFIFYDTDNQTITIYTGDYSYGITIQDKNLGSSMAGTGVESYGYYFQRGNNHGNYGDSPTTNTKLSSYDLSIWANKGYSGSETKFIIGSTDYRHNLTNYDEIGAIQHSLWGGSGDNENINGIVKGYDTLKHVVTNLSGRQGPCPEGYHVPSIGEWQELIMLWCNANSNICSIKSAPSDWGEEFAWAKYLEDGDGIIGIVFSDDMKLPITGYRDRKQGKIREKDKAMYSSSSPRGGSESEEVWNLVFSSNIIDPSEEYDMILSRSNGKSLRCFKNFYVEFPKTLNLFFMSDDEEVGTGEITENMTGAVPEKAKNMTKIGYELLGWTRSGATETEIFDFETTPISGAWADESGNVYFIAQWTGIKYSVEFTGTDVEGTMPNQEFTYGIAQNLTANTFTKNGYTFSGWTDGTTGYTDGQEVVNLTTTSGDVITLTAEWTKIETKPSGGYSGGGGRSNKTSSDEKDTINNPSVTDVTAPLESGAQGDSDDGSPLSRGDTASAERGSTQNYSQEFQEAYEFAKEKGITTMPTINDANMNGKLTRIAMAKMLSYYAINVLGQKPDETRNNKFNDITDKLDAQYDSGVTLAYQLGIMGINMQNNNFRPNDEVTRAEFATALSRMLYSTPDGKPYYATHLQKLKAEGILKNDDYKMKELRGYVMIMLKRSAK